MLTTIHMIVCWACSGLALQTETFRPKQSAAVGALLRRKVAGLALAFCLSVTCGNVALRFIFVSFAQMVTAASPLFTMALMYLYTGKRYSRAATLSMLPMCGGVMLCVHGETNFHVVGFGAVILATLLRGIKSILQQRLLTSPEEKLDSISLLFHMSGPSIVFLRWVALPCLHILAAWLRSALRHCRAATALRRRRDAPCRAVSSRPPPSTRRFGRFGFTSQRRRTCGRSSSCRALQSGDRGQTLGSAAACPPALQRLCMCSLNFCT